ncbi:DUF3888 domain-containing protein [Bacillus aerolatus]|uniref:DUF3888 domain-containing protein n=1 Tax=Bacillus aerolatus TaxID=2653354 RepID=A0A6I1FK65_9BACI|nr:DUF3888 domain-containing protein [Bacillus aerolatus]KAB7707032.1 DUF3888 domain-containing protein [Bacillus aerolatus]
MRKIIRSLSLSILIIFLGVNPVFGQEVSKADMEEVLTTQFHKQISDSIKKSYNVRFPQFESAQIISIKKEYLPESSEELKPGKFYEIKIRVKVLNDLRQGNSLVITLNNDNSSGEFVVKEVKKE